MKYVSYILPLLVFVVSFSSNSHAQVFGASELIRAVPVLESGPLAKDAKTIRALAVRYVIETNDVSVTLCGGELMAAILDKKNKNSTELIGQYTVAMAAFKLQNPDDKDENAAQYAGLASAVRAYQAILREKPKNKHIGMEDLVAKLEKDELKAAVENANCTGK